MMPGTKTKINYFSTSCVVLLTLAASLMLLIVIVSQFNAHPDEDVHLEAAKFYISHWLPPVVGDASTEHAYSNYGASYLDWPDTVYLFAGKFIALLRFTGWPPYLLVRLFNFSLFVLLFLVLLRASAEFRVPLYAILLLSPQIWYVYSYFNSDAFSFLVGICLMIELFKFIGNPEKDYPAVKVGVLLGILMVAKRNYYVLFPFVGAVALWHSIFFCKTGQRRSLAKKWLRVILISAIIGLPKIVYQEWVNGFALDHARVVQMERTAARGFKPSQAGEPYAPWFVRMRARGHTAQELLLSYQWPWTTFRSTVGLYGWMDHFGPNWYYWTMLLLYLLLFGRLCLPLQPFAFRDLTLIVITILGAIALSVASFLLSWVSSYQPQGKYLFPVFCMFTFLLAYQWDKLPKGFFYIGFLCTGALSLVSFSFLWN
jgi:hypothetical protein